MKVKDVMTPDPIFCSPETPLSGVARLMKDGDCGEIPVCRGEQVVGVVTDRDITCRTIAEDLDPLRMTARDIMTLLVITTTPDEDLDKAIKLMEEEKVRRLPVVDSERRLVGLLSATDIAAFSEKKGGELLRRVSGPSLWKSKMRVSF